MLSPEVRVYVGILILIAVGQIAFTAAMNGFTTFPDTPQYVETVKWYMDGSGAEIPLRIQRPLEIFMVMVFEPLLGITSSMALVNSLLYIASVPFFFSFARKLLKDDRTAFVSTILFSSSFCVLYWGLGLLTDMLTWFLLCMSFDFLADFALDFKTKDAYKIAAVVGIGMLNKEGMIAVAIVMFFIILAKGLKERKEPLLKLFRFIPPLAISVVPFLLMQLAIYLYFGPGHSFFDYHLTHNVVDVKGSIWYLPLTFLIAFNMMLVLFALGVKIFVKSKSPLSGWYYLLAMAVCIIPIVAFENYSPRLSFFIFPLLIPPAAIGLMRLIKWFRWVDPKYLIGAFIIAYIVLNNAVALFGDEIRSLLGIWSR